MDSKTYWQKQLNFLKRQRPETKIEEEAIERGIQEALDSLKEIDEGTYQRPKLGYMTIELEDEGSD